LKKALALARLMRPHHWVKNVFILAGLFFSVEWKNVPLLIHAAAAFAAFCLGASGIYCLNDAADAEKDRLHPVKRLRPVASGELKKGTARAAGSILIAAGLGLAARTDLRLGAMLGAYLIVNLLYSRWLKDHVLVDVFCIASGFILRLLAGTWGLGIEPSQWFLLCTMALSLFLGFSKRYAERIAVDRPLEEKRSVLKSYSPEFLRALMSITLSATLITYGLYTTSPRTLMVHGTERLIYTLPIAMFGMFRYLYLVMERGLGENTIADILRDRQMILTCAAYLACTGTFLFL
jgi:4-hydroxybenzoate polyprenyltransferase